MNCFVLNPNPVFTATITVHLPGGEEQQLQATFKALAMTEADKLLNQSPADFVQKVIIGWQDVVDESGDPIPYSDKTLKQLADLDWFVAAAIETYSFTLRDSGQKNLKKSQRH